MKTLKKALSVILGLAIMLSCVMGMQVSVAAEGTLAVSVGEATVADGVVTVPVVVDANTGFQAMTVTAAYDSAVLTLVGAEKAAFSDAEDKAVFGPYTANPFKMMWAYALSEENITTTGEIATLTFNVVEGADVDSTDINIEVTEAWDVNGAAVTATATDGTVEFVKECTHEWGDWVITQPTKTETGLKVRTCDLCDATEEVVIAVPELDTTMVFRTPLVSIGETLGLRLRARTSVLSDTTATYKFVVTPQKYDGTTLAEYTGETVEYPVTKSGTNYQVDMANIAITELGLDVEAYIVRYNADGIFEAYSEVDIANPVEILKGMINATATEGTTAYKLNTMIVDLLNLGAEAQDYFPGLLNSTTCDLYTATRVNEGVDQKYASGAVSLNAINNTVWNSESAVTSTTNALAMSVNINPAPAPVYTIRNATATGNNPLDYSKLTFTVSYTSQYDGKTRTETISGDMWNNLVSKKHLRYTFAKVAMYDADQEITAVLTYDGTEVFTSTYTVENFISEYGSDAAMGTMVTNIGKFGASARAYFLALS